MYVFPGPDAFKGQFGETLDFAPAPDLRAMADELIDRHFQFNHLPQLKIGYLWKAKGGAKSGKLTLGKTQKPSGLLDFYAQVDFIIWLAVDNCQLAGMEQQQVEATLFHELCHVGRDPETDEPCLVPHDVEMFAAEVREYGLWRTDLHCLRQLGLFERQVVDASTGEIHEEVPAWAGTPRGVHYHDDNPQRPRMVCRDANCMLPHYPAEEPKAWR